MKIVYEGASHLTDNMKAEIRQVNGFVMRLETYQIWLTSGKIGSLVREYCHERACRIIWGKTKKYVGAEQ